jgi:hypothetical protein
MEKINKFHDFIESLKSNSELNAITSVKIYSLVLIGFTISDLFVKIQDNHFKLTLTKGFGGYLIYKLEVTDIQHIETKEDKKNEAVNILLYSKGSVVVKLNFYIPLMPKTYIKFKE